jgi:hypothetical protein
MAVAGTVAAVLAVRRSRRETGLAVDDIAAERAAEALLTEEKKLVTP